MRITNFPSAPHTPELNGHSSTPTSRFIYGYIRGMLQHRSCPVKVSLKVAESDKHKMVADLHNARTQATARIGAVRSDASIRGQEEPWDGLPEGEAAPEGDREGGLPSLRFRDAPCDEHDGWIVFEKPVLYLYAGKGPYVSRDFMQFPVSRADDGFIDVVIQEVVSRS